MKLQRISALAKKELKKTIREPAVLFMIFLFPIVFVFAFGASFGGVGVSQTITYNIGVVNMDHGDSVNASQILTHGIIKHKNTEHPHIRRQPNSAKRPITRHRAGGNGNSDGFQPKLSLIPSST